MNAEKLKYQLFLKSIAYKKRFADPPPSIYGRRRVGKTFLIRNTFQEELVFEFFGIHNASLEQQLENFSTALSKAIGTLPIAKPHGWIQAFTMLTDYLTPII